MPNFEYFLSTIGSIWHEFDHGRSKIDLKQNN